jgi:hypothetical protein
MINILNTRALSESAFKETTDFNPNDWNRASNLYFDESVHREAFDLDATTYSVLDTSAETEMVF